jgi:ankyrin repeat protein
MDINVRHEDRCLLANAVNVEGDEFLSALLEMGIDVTGLNGYEALVSSLNDFEKMEMLISHGADVNVTFHREGKTLLHMACNGCMYVVSELLEAGTNVNALDRWGNSALMLAVASEKQKLVSLLLSHGADKDVVNSAGHTALSIAKQKGNHTIVSLLCDTKRTLEM